MVEINTKFEESQVTFEVEANTGEYEVNFDGKMTYTDYKDGREVEY